jgi:hypothetical protein
MSFLLQRTEQGGDEVMSFGLYLTVSGVDVDVFRYLQYGCSGLAMHLEFSVMVGGTSVCLPNEAVIECLTNQLRVGGPCLFVLGSGLLSQLRFRVLLEATADGLGSSLIVYMLDGVAYADWKKFG